MSSKQCSPSTEMFGESGVRAGDLLSAHSFLGPGVWRLLLSGEGHQLYYCLQCLHISSGCLCQKRLQGLPWWRSGWESACYCRGHGFEPWSGRIPHATEQLGPWATITEPVHLEPVLRNKRGRDSVKPVHCDEEWPPLAATRESPRTETKTQHRQK